MNNRQLRKLLPTEKQIDAYKWNSETPEERRKINYIYALNKYNDLLSYRSYSERHKRWTKMVKWVVREKLS